MDKTKRQVLPEPLQCPRPFARGLMRSPEKASAVQSLDFRALEAPVWLTALLGGLVGGHFAWGLPSVLYNMEV